MKDDEHSEDPKIIVDDDWKEQVAKEKQAAVTQESTDSVKPPSQPDTVTDDDYPPPPDASFEVLVSMLFTQAMAMLGQLPDPASGKTEINKPYAKHYIGTLEMLGEKTKGNLTEAESKMLSEALHAMRMAYVSVKA